MFCVNCGKQIKEDALFCPYCGYKSEEELFGQSKQSNLSKDNNEKSIKKKKSKNKVVFFIVFFIIIFSILCGIYSTFRYRSKTGAVCLSDEMVDFGEYVMNIPKSFKLDEFMYENNNVVLHSGDDSGAHTVICSEPVKFTDEFLNDFLANKKDALWSSSDEMDIYITRINQVQYYDVLLKENGAFCRSASFMYTSSDFKYNDEIIAMIKSIKIR